MSRVPPLDRRATYEDLLRLPDDLVAEIVDGELHADPRTASRVAASCAVSLGGMLLRGLEPGGGADNWQILPGPELHLGGDILVPGLAAWRRFRLPELPATAYFSIAPDWVCEIFSASVTASLRARKMATYVTERVSYAWLIDVVAHTLEVRRAEGVAGRSWPRTSATGSFVPSPSRSWSCRWRRSGLARRAARAKTAPGDAGVDETTRSIAASRTSAQRS